MCLYDVQVGTGGGQRSTPGNIFSFSPPYFVAAGVGWGGVVVSLSLELTDLARMDTREPQGPS